VRLASSVFSVHDAVPIATFPTRAGCGPRSSVATGGGAASQSGARPHHVLYDGTRRGFATRSFSTTVAHR
jgi:hypothetical protein